MVDNFHYLAGPVKRLCAFSKKILGVSNLNDVTSVILEFESGPLGYLGTTIVIPDICTLAVYGTQANVWSEEDGSRFFLQRKAAPARGEETVAPGDAEAEQLGDFARCIRDGGSPETGGKEGLEVAAVLEAIIESVDTGKVVELSRFRN
jgi:predicted dehydrogenase